MYIHLNSSALSSSAVSSALVGHDERNEVRSYRQQVTPAETGHSPSALLDSNDPDLDSKNSSEGGSPRSLSARTPDLSQSLGHRHGAKASAGETVADSTLLSTPGASASARNPATSTPERLQRKVKRA